MKKELTVQNLIDILNAIDNKDLPIDIQFEGCFEQPSGNRHTINGKIIRHVSDIKKRVGAYSIIIDRDYKYSVETDIIDGYEPLTKDDCADIMNRIDDKTHQELILDAINYRRKNYQKAQNKKSVVENNND